MFNKKTLSTAVAAAATGMSLGKVLGVAGVAAVTSGLSATSAVAQINVTGTVGNAVVIAAESVSVGTTGVDTVGVGEATALDVQGQLGIGVAGSDQVFLRFDWTDAELAEDLALGSIVVTDATGGTIGSTSLTDGQTGDSSAIFGVTADGDGFSQTSGFVLDVGTSGIGLAASSSDVRVRVFETQTNAINETLALTDQSLANAVSLQSALTISFSSQTATAEVTEDFLEFTSGVTGTLGFLTVAANTNLVADSTTGFQAISDFDDLVSTGTSSTVTYTGDFSFATASGFFLGTGPSCATSSPGLSVDTSTFATATADLVDANTNALCVTVDGANETIPEASYDAAVVAVHDVTSSSPNSTSDSGTVGEIDRNGTTVEVAYVTTFTDYNQRILINSRHPVDVPYTITFSSEDGVTTSALPAASGTLTAGENLVLRARDVVAITGGTRCAATVTVVAPSNNISVATTQVNLADGGTDTVSYN